eukprot:Hpha_TRINITY_DN10644_c0_g1::TRINITY_DN10644_c0_g1_i2::g.156601::m.156601/K18166/FOXRED1; FAD-dependent oxidoreductase domain-containing protein 1
MNPSELGDTWGWLNTEGVTAGAYGKEGEGWFDPSTLLRLLRKRCCELGCTMRTGDVVGFDIRDRRVNLVQMKDGENVSCGQVVNAAGPAAGQVAQWLGVSIPVVPKKRYTQLVQAPVDLRTAKAPMPLLVDVTGAWMRPEGVGFICGISPPACEDPDCASDDFDVKQDAQDRWEDCIWPALAERVNGMEECRLVSQWAGHYDYNTVDQNGIIGAHPDCHNAVFANGFSGHGLQQSPAVGRAVAEIALHGKFLTLDLTRMAPTRFEDQQPLLERNVV